MPPVTNVRSSAWECSWRKYVGSRGQLLLAPLVHDQKHCLCKDTRIWTWQSPNLLDQAAQMEEQLKATYEQIKQIELELSTLEESEAVMQTRALQISKATADRLEIDNIVAGISAWFGFVKQVLPKPWFYMLITNSHDTSLGQQQIFIWSWVKITTARLAHSWSIEYFLISYNMKFLS